MITAAIDERAVLHWYNAISVLHHSDIVEEVATQRQGEVDAIDQYISEGQKLPPHRWRVRFLDGKEPHFQYFVKETDLRLIRCPHRDQRVLLKGMSRKKFCLDRSRDLFFDIQPTVHRLRCDES